MTDKLRPHLTYANVAGTVAIFIALGGGAAAIGGVGDKQPVRVVNADGEIRACYDKKGPNRGEVRLLVMGGCTRQERKILWNQQGPAGGVGEQGPPGPATGPAGGDLTGNYPDPQIATGAVTEAELGCGSDPDQQMVKVGSFCIDKYEASVWDSPTGGTQLISEAQIDAACPNNGQPTGGAPCTAFYARSVPGVEPARRITWFQAQQALANSAKELPTNAQWQAAASGTPDTGGADSGPPSCNTDSTLAVANTGSRVNCVSRFGAFDMVGNLWEWVGDWLPRSPVCGTWSFSDDEQCVAGAATTGEPGALIRGGDFFDDASNPGPFAVVAGGPPSTSAPSWGFRGAR